MSDASSPRGEEDSGLINLDALMGRGDPEPSPWTAPNTPAPAPPPAVVAPAPAKAASAPVSARHPDDSLDGIASAKPLPATASVPPPAPVSGTAAPAPAPPEVEKRDKRRLVPILLAFAAVAGIAAVALHPWRTAATDTVSSTPTPTAHANSASPAKPVDRKTTAAGNEQPSGVDPNALPTANPAPAPTVVKPPVAATTTTAAAAATPKPEVAAKLSEKDLGTMPSGDQGDLAGAMKGAVGAKDAPTEVAKSADNTGANQIRPAAGQVVGAIGAVLPAARACLGPDDTIRSGSMVFASDGSVKQVSLSGGAKSSDDCIRSALSKAKLQPFADDSFTTHVTVRP